METFPRLKKYIETLPAGLSSYSHCQGKASMFAVALKIRPLASIPPGLPDHLRVYLETEMPPNRWVRELDYVMFTMAMADIHGFDNAGMRQFWREVMTHINNSAMYGLLFRFLSPRMLVATVASRWGSFHQGTTCKAERTPQGMAVTLGYPKGLFPELILQGYAGVFDALTTHSRLFKGHSEVELIGFDNFEARYVMRDFKDAP